MSQEEECKSRLHRITAEEARVLATRKEVKIDPMEEIMKRIRFQAVNKRTSCDYVPETEVDLEPIRQELRSLGFRVSNEPCRISIHWGEK